jgi:hypothetical protein
MLKRLIVCAGLCAGLFAVACSDRAGNLFEPIRQHAIAAGDSVFIRSGDGQIAPGGTRLPKSLSIVVRNGGTRIARARGTFTVTSGGGTVSRAGFWTNSDGIATVDWTLGASGPQTVTATLEDGNSVVFNATAIPVGSSLTIVSGDGQAGVPGDSLAANVVVELKDPLGAPIRGVTVRFTTPASQGGSVRDAQRATNSLGKVANRWMLGWGASSQTLKAFVPGVDTVVFNATTSSEGVSFTILSGNAQTGNPGTPLSSPVIVQLMKRGVPVPNVNGTFAVTSGGGVLSRTSFSTNSNGRASTSWTPGTAS